MSSRKTREIKGQPKITSFFVPQRYDFIPIPSIPSVPSDSQQTTSMSQIEEDSQITSSQITVSESQLDYIPVGGPNIIEEIEFNPNADPFGGKYKRTRFISQGANNIQDLYNNILSIIERDAGNQRVFASIFFNDSDGNVRQVGVNILNLASAQDLEDYINNLRLGNVQGSDAISDEFTLDLNKFDVSILQLDAINAKDDSEIIYKTMNILSTLPKKQIKRKRSLLEKFEDSNPCVRAVFAHFGIEFNPEIHCRSDEMIKTLIDHDITILSNTLSLSKDFKFIHFKKYARDNFIYPQEHAQLFEHVYIHQGDSEKICVVSKDHIDIILNDQNSLENLEFKDNLRMNYHGNLFVDSKKSSNITYKESSESSSNSIPCETKKESNDTTYVFFDYETVVDYHDESIMVPYSLSVFVSNDTQNEILSNFDLDSDDLACSKIRKLNSKTFIGHDCTAQFFQWFFNDLTTRIRTNVVFIGFNNVCFDNLILYRDIKKLGINIEIESQIFACGGLLNFSFRYNGRKIDTFDVSKHLVGSLKKLCADFRVKVCGKRAFDHEIPQAMFNDSKLFEWIAENKDDLIEYNEFDVISLAIIYHRYRAALLHISEAILYAKDLTSSKTIGGLIYKIFKDYIEKIKNTLDFVPENDQIFSQEPMNSKNNSIFPKLPHKWYTDLLEGKSAGRVQCFQGKTKFIEQIVSFDVCSLYPYVMACVNRWYPYGNLIETVGAQFEEDLIGFYYTTFDQSNLARQNLPLILPLKERDHLGNITENNYNCRKGICETPMLISSVDVKQLRRYGCKYQIHGGFYFSHKMKSCDMFKPILQFMQAKNVQDNLKKSKSTEYNPALRETLKLFMNSLSGKVIEGLHTDKMKIFKPDQLEEMNKFFATQRNVKFIDLLGDSLHVSYEIDSSERKTLLKQRPVYLGALIYAHAREHMYNYGYSRVGLDRLLYTDTDSIKFPKKYVDDYLQSTEQESVPHWPEVEEYDPKFINHKLFDLNSKVFGSFEDELQKDHDDNNLFYCLQKKVWCVLSFNNGVPTNAKWRGKGFNSRSIMLSNGTPIGNSDSESNEESAETQYHFFETLFNNNTFDLECKSFRKIVGNQKICTSETPERFNKQFCCIQLNTITKTINLTEIEYPESRMLNEDGSLKM
jgi:hypothetical protein